MEQGIKTTLHNKESYIDNLQYMEGNLTVVVS